MIDENDNKGRSVVSADNSSMTDKFPNISISRSDLDKRYGTVLTKALEKKVWYDKKKPKWMLWAMTVKILAVIGLGLSILIPAIQTMGETDSVKGINASPIEISFFLLLLSGFVFSLDHLFMLTGTWIRYTNAGLAIDLAIATAEHTWKSLRVSLINDAKAFENKDKAFEIFRRLAEKVEEIKKTETEAWATGLVSANKELGARIKAQTEEVKGLRVKAQEEEKKAKADAVRSEKTVGVVVNLTNHQQLIGPTTVMVGDQIFEFGEPVENVVFESVPIGRHKIIVNSMLKKVDHSMPDANVPRFDYSDLLSITEEDIKKDIKRYKVPPASQDQ